MKQDSVSRADPRPMGASRPRPAVQAREAGLELIRRVNRWLIAAAVAAAGLFSLLAGARLPRAHGYHGQGIVELERCVAGGVALGRAAIRRRVRVAGAGAGTGARSGSAVSGGLRGVLRWGARPDRARCGI